MKVIYKKKISTIKFEDLDMGDFFELVDGVYMVIYDGVVVIRSNSSVRTGDIYNGPAIKNKFADKKVKRLDVHLVVES